MAHSHIRLAKLSSGIFPRRESLLFVSLTSWVDQSFLSSQNIVAGLPALFLFLFCFSWVRGGEIAEGCFLYAFKFRESL